MAFKQTDLARIKELAQDIIELIGLHDDNTGSDHESADTIGYIDDDIGKLSVELARLSELVDWDSTL